MRYGVHVAPFGELADPSALAEVAIAAEESGFDGVFLWDHIARPHKDVPIADTMTALAVIAMRTTRIRLGALVTPLSRRRPTVYARQLATLDQLSGGRMVAGVGLGVDSGGELSRLGEITDERERANVLDEAIDVVRALWRGEPIRHLGERFTVEDVRFTPTPRQHDVVTAMPAIPMWTATRAHDRRRPIERAARLDGIAPETEPHLLRLMLDRIGQLCGDLGAFDVACKGPPGADPQPFVDAGATWWLVALPEGWPAMTALREVAAGPQRIS